jgi:hypothetical protein
MQFLSRSVLKGCHYSFGKCICIEHEKLPEDDVIVLKHVIVYLII